MLRAVRSPIIIQSAFILGAAVGIQAALEFLGLGSPREASWGGMLDVAFRNIYDEPGWRLARRDGHGDGAVFVLLGNALRDALDPASKRRTLSPRRTSGYREEAAEESRICGPHARRARC